MAYQIAVLDKDKKELRKTEELHSRSLFIDFGGERDGKANGTLYNNGQKTLFGEMNIKRKTWNKEEGGCQIWQESKKSV